MTIKEAIKQRHMVRKYTDKPIPSNLVELLNARIAENNTAHGLNMKLVIGNSDGIGGMAKMLLTKTVHSYIVLAGKENSDLDEKLGYCGADLCLYAQTLGLNTWWCGGMFNGKGALKHLAKTSESTVLLLSVMVRPRVYSINPKPQRKSASTTEHHLNGLLMAWMRFYMLLRHLISSLTWSRVTGAK